MKAYEEYVKEFKEAIEAKGEEKTSSVICANRSEREWIRKAI